MEFPDDIENKQEYESVLPLVNIVFLLLIFFMLAGAFTSADLFKVDPPTSSNTSNHTDLNKEQILLVGEKGTIAWGETQLTPDTLSTHISNINASRNESLKEVSIKADAQSPSHIVIDIVHSLQKSGINEIRLLTIKE